MPMPRVTCTGPEKAPEPRPHTPSHMMAASPARCRGVGVAMGDGHRARAVLLLLPEVALEVYKTCAMPHAAC